MQGKQPFSAFLQSTINLNYIFYKLVFTVAVLQLQQKYTFFIKSQLLIFYSFVKFSSDTIFGSRKYGLTSFNADESNFSRIINKVQFIFYYDLDKSNFLLLHLMSIFIIRCNKRQIIKIIECQKNKNVRRDFKVKQSLY